MLLVKFSIFIVLMFGQSHCDDVELKSKVKDINNTVNSSINQTQYSNNGIHVPQKSNISTHRISAYDQQMIGQCGGIFRNIQNVIESPKFISPHPICNLRCEYQIVSPYICENYWHVQFLEFSVDDSPTCERDKIIMNYNDVMCGKVTGIKKYRTVGGILNITMISTSWDSMKGRGFKLLITRLPCIDESNENQTEAEALEPLPEIIHDEEHNENHCFHVNASFTVDNPTYENQHPIYGVPIGFNRTNVDLSGRQDIPVIPLPPPPTRPPVFPIFPNYPQTPQTDIPVTPFPPPPFLPQCCRNIYNQQRFLIISQGFPAYTVLNNDCTFVIQKSSPNVCRLRIHFKYFLLDDAQQQGQFGCFNNFIEIDGQRICGCKTNFVYETQWGLEPKVIRLRTAFGKFFNAQGFVLDIEQQDCPFKIQSETKRVRRHLLSKTFLHPMLMKNHFLTSHFAQQGQHPDDDDESFRAKFFTQSNPGFVNNVCTFNHLKFLQLKVETIGILKHFCVPTY